MRICELAEPYDPAFFVGVPNGATGIANDVALECGVHVLGAVPKLGKDPDTRVMSYADEQSEWIVQYSSRKGALIEDVFRTGFSTEKALTLPYMTGQIAVGICVFDRSIPDNRLALPIPIESVASEPIPIMLSPESEFWAYAMPVASS